MLRDYMAEDKDLYVSGPNWWPNLGNFRPVLENYTKGMHTL